MTFTSYAQNLEDVMLWRALQHVTPGVYIDVGAQDPVADSLSFAFHQRGWKGVHVEPMPEYAQALREQRTDDVVIQAAVSDQPGVIPFFAIPGTGISTADDAIAEEHRQRGFEVMSIAVPAVTLESVISACPGTEIHWLKLDIEGFESKALSSWGTGTRLPWVVVVESTTPLSQIESHLEWEHSLVAKGYEFVYFDGLNRFYLSPHHGELRKAFESPPNVFDGFALSGRASTTLLQVVKRQHEDDLQSARDALSASEEACLTAADDLRRHLAQAQKQLADAQRDLDEARSVADGERARLNEEINSAIANAAAQVVQLSGALHESTDKLLSVESHAAIKYEELSRSAALERRDFITMHSAETDRERRHAEALIANLIAGWQAQQASQRDAFQAAVRLLESELQRASERELRLSGESDRSNGMARTLLEELAVGQMKLAEQLHGVQQEAFAERERVTRLHAEALAAMRQSLDGLLLKLRESQATEDRDTEGWQRVTLDLRAAREEAHAAALAQAGQVSRLAEVLAAQTLQADELRKALAVSADAQARSAMSFADQVAVAQASALQSDVRHAESIEALTANFREAQYRLTTAAAQLEQDLREQLSSERTGLAELQTAHQQALDRLQAIRQSWFWRLTSPLRWFSERTKDYVDGRATAPVATTSHTTARAEEAPSPQSGAPRAKDPVDLSPSPSVATASPPASASVTESPRTIDLNMATEHKVSSPAKSADELLELQDEAFVRCTYLTVLGRSADPSGREHYLGLVRKGVAKGQIVASIARSPEGRSKAIDLPGLAEVKRRFRRRLPSLLGRLIRRGLSTTLEPLEMQVRSTENLMYRLHRSQTTRLEAIESQLGELRALSAESLQVMQRLQRMPREAAPTRPSEVAVSTPARRIYYYVDHTVACPTNTGMQRVARRLADALIKAGESITFVKWDPQAKRLVLLNRKELQYLGQWNGPQVSDTEARRYPDTSGVDVGIDSPTESEPAWLLVPEVTHITYQAQPMTMNVLEAAQRAGLKTAFIFYDATPLRRTELQPMSDAHATYMQHLLLADLVLPISHWVSADLSAYLRLDQLASAGPGPYIRPLPLPGESHLSARVKHAEVPALEEPYVLSVGSIVPHKNQITLIRAFDHHCRRNPAGRWKLLLAGNMHPDLRQEVLGICAENPRIAYLGEVDDQRLVDLYKGCSFTCFPSVMEGFGLPILESLWFGKPCIAANFGAMAEVATGGGCVMVNTANVDELEASLAGLIELPARLAALTAEAQARHIDSWQHYVARLVDCLSDVDSPLSRVGHIYYWVDHTAIYDGNTGIQRVVRGLARSLMEEGAQLIPVRWSNDHQRIVPASSEELINLARWNGPAPSSWSAWKPVEQVTARDWLLVPELCHFMTEKIREYGRSVHLRCSWIFYDAIPWKMTDLYPPEATAAHRDYMLAMRSAEKVMAISEFSRDDLMDFLTAADARCGELHHRIVACSLPGEFVQVTRALTPKTRRDGEPIRILCVGTVEPRKNHLGLLEAYKLVRQSTSVPTELVIAGGNPYPELAEQVQQLIDQIPGASWIRRIDDAGLQSVYDRADFTVYPSVEEGFGLPILESLWNARPCVCADYGAMREVAVGGGCVMVDVRDSRALAGGMLQLINDPGRLQELGHEATVRGFKTWRDYARDVLGQLADERAQVFEIGTKSPITSANALLTQMPNLRRRPLLSVCISTYNRAAWLAVNLRNLARLWPTAHPDVELLVCDNTSTDSTPTVVEPYLSRSDFTYVRNAENVGMLGNLRVTANHASGQYVWILGDDDLLMPGTIERVLAAIRAAPSAALVYMNYAYTRNDKAEEVVDLDQFLGASTPVADAGPDFVGTVRDVSAKSGNFFTAIYCLVFRRDHAVRAYSQNTSGRPFSTMLTCIPTTYHVLNHMMDEPAYWMGQPQIVVNLNVSWMKYAPLWILTRLPEAFDVAERYGGDPLQIDHWRRDLVPHVQHWLNEIVAGDPEGNAQFISIQRLVNSFKHLPEFKSIASSLRDAYHQAHLARHPVASVPTEAVFAAFQ